MPITNPAVAAQIAAWRSGAVQSPAGPLFSSQYSQAEIVEIAGRNTQLSICTGSGTIQCC